MMLIVPQVGMSTILHLVQLIGFSRFAVLINGIIELSLVILSLFVEIVSDQKDPVELLLDFFNLVGLFNLHASGCVSPDLSPVGKTF